MPEENITPVYTPEKSIPVANDYSQLEIQNYFLKRSYIKVLLLWMCVSLIIQLTFRFLKILNNKDLVFSFPLDLIDLLFPLFIPLAVILLIGISSYGHKRAQIYILVFLSFFGLVLASLALQININSLGCTLFGCVGLALIPLVDIYWVILVALLPFLLVSVWKNSGKLLILKSLIPGFVISVLYIFIYIYALYPYWAETR